MTVAPAKTSSRRWLERALLLIGLCCLGYWAYAWADARYTQYQEGKLLDEAASARPAAANTDALGTFHGPAAGSRRRKVEGTLVGRIEIPRVGVSAIVLEGISNKTLRRGVGHIPETSLPGAEGNAGLAAHRDSFFRALKDIRENDLITVKTLDGTFEYRVEWTQIVQPEDTQVLAATGEPVLTLVTCYPFYYVGSAPERFIVRARRSDPETAAGGGG
jgi:sortase A